VFVDLIGGEEVSGVDFRVCGFDLGQKFWRKHALNG
jgi:hypothetical protein